MGSGHCYSPMNPWETDPGHGILGRLLVSAITRQGETRRHGAGMGGSGHLRVFEGHSEEVDLHQSAAYPDCGGYVSIAATFGGRGCCSCCLTQDQDFEEDSVSACPRSPSQETDPGYACVYICVCVLEHLESRRFLQSSCRGILTPQVI